MLFPTHTRHLGVHELHASQPYVEKVVTCPGPPPHRRHTRYTRGKRAPEKRTWLTYIFFVNAAENRVAAEGNASADGLPTVRRALHHVRGGEKAGRQGHRRLVPNTRYGSSVVVRTQAMSVFAQPSNTGTIYSGKRHYYAHLPHRLVLCVRSDCTGTTARQPALSYPAGTIQVRDHC